MAGLDLRKACLNCLSQVAEDVEDALVYLDAGAGEALHFIGGLAALLPLGPRAVCSLEHASPVDAAVQWTIKSKGPVQKVFVMTTRLLSDAHRYILRCLRMHESLKICTILTSISEEAHSAHPDTPLGPDAFHDYRRLLLEDFQVLVPTSKSEQTIERREDVHPFPRENNDMEDDGHAFFVDSDSERTLADTKTSPESPDTKSKVAVEAEVEESLDVGLTITVKHFPMILCPLTSKIFVFPSGGAFAEAPLSDKLDNALGPGLPGIDAGVTLSEEDRVPPGATLLAHFLQHLAGQLDLKLDIFTLGSLSHVVGKLLTQLSGFPDVSGRTKRSAGLLLIDRTLDLITPSCHGDSLVDRFFASMPRRTLGNDILRSAAGASSISLRRLPLDIRISMEAATGHAKNMGDDDIGGWMDLTFCTFLSNSNNEGDLKLQAPEKQEDISKWKDDAGCRSLEGAITLLNLMGGSLFDSKESPGTEHLDLLFDKTTKESVLTIRKWLQEALHKENMKLPGRSRLGAATADEIHALWKQLSRNSSCAVRHAGLIQLAKATEDAMGPNFGPRWEALNSAEKILMMSVGDSSQSVAFQIRDLVHQSVHAEDRKASLLGRSQGLGLLSLRDALTLAIVGYALAGDSFGSSVSGGPFSWEEERELKEAVVDAILQGPHGENLGFFDGLEDSLEAHWQRQQSTGTVESIDTGFPEHEAEVEDNEQEEANVKFDEGWDAWEDDLSQDEREKDEIGAEGKGYGQLQLKLGLRDRVEEAFRTLHRVSEARRYLPVKDKPLPVEEKSGFGGSSTMQRSLIYKILSLVFAKKDIPGMEHHSSAVGRFFKSGLGRFGLGQAKPKLSDSKVLLVFVIGGINGVEVREAKEAQVAYSMAEGVELLLGGTTFLTPDDIYDLLLGSSSSL